MGAENDGKIKGNPIWKSRKTHENQGGSIKFDEDQWKTSVNKRKDLENYEFFSGKIMFCFRKPCRKQKDKQQKTWGSSSRDAQAFGDPLDFRADESRKSVKEMNFIKNGLRGGNSSCLKIGVEVCNFMATVWRHGGFELLPFSGKPSNRKQQKSILFHRKKTWFVQWDSFRGISYRKLFEWFSAVLAAIPNSHDVWSTGSENCRILPLLGVAPSFNGLV